MGRLSNRDGGWLRDARRRLRTFDPADRDVVGTIVAELHERARTSAAAVYGISERAGQLGLSFAHFSQEEPPGTRAVAVLDRWLRSRNRGMGIYDPKCPAPRQRNQITLIRPASEIVAGAPVPVGIEPRGARALLERVVEEVLRPAGWDRAQARVLLCDGPRLLAWFGYANDRGFDHRQLALLRALAAPVRARLLLEEALSGSVATRRALEAALELLPVAGFVVSPSRAILFANALACAALEADRSLAVALCTPGGPDARRFDVTRLPTDGTCHYLVLLRAPATAMDVRVAHAARGWGLTPREAEVLHHLARGASNRCIAAKLGCADRTVEIHVSRILAKAEAESRGALVAKILEETRWGG